ncbi:glycosyl transferase family 2 [Burkholderia stagnalis]|uniref:Glycosyl transferase family 2 n=1 Tax=Burkholderia stagnalis TaxID=1503054 RepID=A0A119WB40_9BURK|nr:glycosyl transferase family 2 [Burkholderia stagnalis]KWA51386.1 glycosyl transferase family 2 [Burkholderia stagnalis]KWA54525.1 glycosyl transferase family 2 [Burkholderia stagnalis]KWA56045.1 glycosyl transferase family 2 [Burkholderia stagnalis]KWC99727.1 glycosyl transferase family 2 [Burkholderia stagnalis]
MAHATRLVFQLASRQVALRGGCQNVFRHGLATFQREGINGLRARLSRLSKSAGLADGTSLDELYHAWIDRYDTLTEQKRNQALAEMAHFQSAPLISIVVPTYNSDAHFLQAMIESVRQQLYPNWELCIADDASTSESVKQVLEAARAQDERIKVVYRTENGHISEASNSALAIANGQFVALLDHDDVLPAHALFMAVKYMNRYPRARMFYSDEDKLSVDGKRTSPYFKSDWNPQLFLAQNMFSHFGIYETALAREAGGFRKGFEGSQDYDLALRCVELAGHDSVVHIPHVLYHWRVAPGSTASSGSEKPYALLAAIRALEEHLARTHTRATVEHPCDQHSTLRVRYALPQPAPKISILIPTRDGLSLIKQCIDSIFAKTNYPDYEIIVIDNGSVKSETLTYFESLKSEPRIRVIRDDSPFNYSALNNRAAALATGDYLCLLNNDIEIISPEWLDELVGIASQPGNGAVGAALWYPNDTLQHGGVVIGLGGVAGHMHTLLPRGGFGYFCRAAAAQNLSAVTAACLVIRKSIYLEVGGLNEELAVAFNDVDFCLRVREAGYRNVWTPFAELYHHESATRGSDMDPDKYQRFVGEVRWMEQRWGDHLELDPAYNPNLTLSGHDAPFAFADPPRIGMLD